MLKTATATGCVSGRIWKSREHVCELVVLDLGCRGILVQMKSVQYEAPATLSGDPQPPLPKQAESARIRVVYVTISFRFLGWLYSRLRRGEANRVSRPALQH